MLPAKIYRSNGKLLISGEYLVLDGAVSLAVPVKPGQSLQVEPVAGGTPVLNWNSLVKGDPWFQASFRLTDLEILSTSDPDIAHRLRSFLRSASSLNPGTLEVAGGLHVTTELEFDLSWGLGSSSTLISNIAYWFGIDPFVLFCNTTQGSGYDIACARSKTAILYQVVNRIPDILEVDLNPPFREHLFFIHLGKKQDSASGIRHYRKSRPATDQQMDRVSAISNRLWQTDNLDEFGELLMEHESIIGQVIGVVPIRQSHFDDFPGVIKSLGAWGGDFILVTCLKERQELEAYFQRKGLQTIISFDEMIF